MGDDSGEDEVSCMAYDGGLGGEEETNEQAVQGYSSLVSTLRRDLRTLVPWVLDKGDEWCSW